MSDKRSLPINKEKVIFVFKTESEQNINTQTTLCSDNFMLKRLKAEK